MKRQTSKTIGLISALLICTGSTVTAFADAAPAAYLRGDIDFNGKVEIEDAQIALKAYTNLVSQKPSELRDAAFQAANVVQNSELDVTDAQCILKYYVENTVNQKAVSWDQLTGRDTLTVPDTGKELVIRAATEYYDLAVMIEQFEKRHPELQDKIRIEYLCPPDYNHGAAWTQKKYETYLAEATDTDLIWQDAVEIFNLLNNDDFSIPVSALGFEESDFANMYGCTREAGSNLNGEHKALTASVSPSGFVYRTDLAEKYLGVKTPAEMQKQIGTWADFEKAAKTVYDKSEGKTAFCEAGTGWEYAAKCSQSDPWFDRKFDVVIPDVMKQNAELYYSFLQNGYFSDCKMFDEGWQQTVVSGKVFGFFAANWLMQDDGSMEYFCGGKDSAVYGKFNFVQGPAAYHWGEQYMLVSPHCDNKTLAYTFLKECMTDEAVLTDFAKETGNFVNNSSVMKKLASGEKGNALLGGQKVLSIQDEIAAASHSQKEYTPACSNFPLNFMYCVEEAAINNLPFEECCEMFCGTHAF